jgi:hypothetical protein
MICLIYMGGFSHDVIATAKTVKTTSLFAHLKVGLLNSRSGRGLHGSSQNATLWVEV